MTSSPAASEPDAGLLAAVVRGEPDALDAWYRREHAAVHRLCLGFLADAAEAEDVTQDAMLHLHDRLPRRHAGSSYRSWRNAVVLNLCRDRLRRIDARRRAETSERAARPAALPGDPGAAAGQEELVGLLSEALGHLPPREREVFVLKDLEECPTGEVAAALGIRPGSVRSLLTLARRRLRGLLGPRLQGEDAAGGRRHG